MRILRYLFYRLRKFVILSGNDTDASIHTILLLGMTIGVHLVTINALLYVVLGSISLAATTSRLVLFVVYAIICVVLYCTLIAKGREDIIMSYYDKRSTYSRIDDIIFGVTYIVITVIALMASFYAMILKNT